MKPLLFLLLIAWDITNPDVPKSSKGTISVTEHYTYFAVKHQDSVSIYSYDSHYEWHIYDLPDTQSVFSISGYDTTLLFAHTANDTQIEIIRAERIGIDTAYNITIPERCERIKLYNDGMLHSTSYPVWYLVCMGSSGIYITHSSDYGKSFFPFDTVTTENATSFDFTTSVNNTGDRLHLIYATQNGNLYLLNGAYPSNFNSPPIQVDSMLPDTPNISISARYDTLFIAYERESSQTFPDRDIYFATYYFEGSDEPVRGAVAASTTEETNPLSVITFYGGIHLFYIDRTSPSELVEAIFNPPYDYPSQSAIYTGNISSIQASNWFNNIGFIITTPDSSTILLANYTVGVRESPRSTSNKTSGVFTVDGRRLHYIPLKGMFIISNKDTTKKVIKLK